MAQLIGIYQLNKKKLTGKEMIDELMKYTLPEGLTTDWPKGHKIPRMINNGAAAVLEKNGKMKPIEDKFGPPEDVEPEEKPKSKSKSKPRPRPDSEPKRKPKPRPPRPIDEFDDDFGDERPYLTMPMRPRPPPQIVEVEPLPHLDRPSRPRPLPGSLRRPQWK